jgi:hypothetical protein
MTAPTEHDLARQHGAPWAQQAIRDELMKMETRQYWPDHEAPDYGGLQGRFAPLWERFNARPLTRVSVWSLMTISALAGVAVAAWL